MEETSHTAEVRQLRRQLRDLGEHTERSRRASVGLVVALVGLIGGLCLPWLTRYEPYDVGTEGLDGGVTQGLDGWLVLGVSVQGFGDGGWATLIATLGPVALAVCVAVVLRDLGSSLATTVMVLGWVGAVGLTLTWIALMAGSADAGPGPVVAAAASLVAAVTGRSVRALQPLPSAVPAVPTASSLLGSGAVRATAPPPED